VTIRDLVCRTPGLRGEHLNRLAAAGALNSLEHVKDRREALWQSELALRPVSPMLEPVQVSHTPSPLTPMTDRQRLNADFVNTGLTIGPHPMSFQRQRMNQLGVCIARDMQQLADGIRVRIAGSVICRQRPSTAKGFVFLTLEDETGISNAIVQPDLFDDVKSTLLNSPYLLIEGVLQNQQGVVSVKADAVQALDMSVAPIASHDFR
jgi:error-prone DNA polymerase